LRSGSSGSYSGSVNNLWQRCKLDVCVNKDKSCAGFSGGDNVCSVGREKIVRWSRIVVRVGDISWFCW
jgi:hypothetical protein